MIRLKDLLKEIMDALPPKPAPTPQVMASPAAHGFDTNFINFIKAMENPTKVGFRKGKWYPHKMPDGSPAIGYGHLIKKSEAQRMIKGLTDAEVEKLLIDDLTAAKKEVYDYIYNTYKIHLILPKKTEEMLIDYVYNVGNLKEFPKFTDAILRGQIDKARTEYKRYYHTPAGKKREMKSRNRAFYNRYLAK